ncbi:ABC transporter ATP-binding protein [Paraglaciecola psychrophila]|jgi:iron(III) transport system ATP-binding protein|uniref:ABC transporter-like protein n=1 Tax=Paraglaciecola psychrophila 170 TaxID=1129794 RepID=K7AS65_9ALTE|nr:ABC transporter ATP-binding protein [Paraglaciecola psychrophila]AGH45452.1 ABC transporter-like protein [Paraglaciecola psychrophila 170]GAC38120.1 sulfate/thiosulfate import ATP-binding protein cysA 2 [Paraglaciecola psychrophila 170]
MLSLNNVSVAYQKTQAVQNVTFELGVGQIGCLLGPSGCGKTSLLRAVAGFEKIAEGQISLRQQLVSAKHSHVEPEKRRVAVVFQDYALFPHLTVAQNIAFGLHEYTRAQKFQRVTELLMLVGLPGYERRYPHALSGGQQQRVALARAMAAKPDLLLLDEPFSSLDAELRDDLAKELRVILKHENTTALMVTHDQNEAFAMADVIGVMDQGRLMQWTDAYALYHRPVNRFVASFVGDGVFLSATIDNNIKLNSGLGVFPINPESGFKQGDKVVFLVRPDDIIHDDESETLAKVVDRSFQGSHILYQLELQHVGHARVLCLALSHHDHQLNELIGIRLDLEHLIVFKDNGDVA